MQRRSPDPKKVVAPEIALELATAIRGLSSLQALYLGLEFWYSKMPADMLCTPRNSLTELGCKFPPNHAMNFQTAFIDPRMTGFRLPPDLLPRALLCATRLQSLHLDQGFVTEQSMQALHALEYLPCLTALRVEGTYMLRPAAAAFARAISGIRLPNLRLFHMQMQMDSSAAEVGREGYEKVIEMAEKLPELPSLTNLLLWSSGNNVPDQNAVHRLAAAVTGAPGRVLRLQVCRPAEGVVLHVLVVSHM
jgi:hypothetical protein